MEAYREKLKKRNGANLVLLIVLAALYGGLLFLTRELPSESDIRFHDFFRGFHLGFFSAVEAVLLYTLVKNGFTLKHPERLRKRYIKETDERMALIRQKTGSFGLAVCEMGLLAGAVAAGFFSETIFFSLLGAAMFVILVENTLMVYYKHKY